MQAISNGESGSSVRSKLNADLSNNFTSLSDGSTVNWDCNNSKTPLAKLTSTQSFTINMTNVLDGASGVLKLTTGTASAITLTFDTDFTNKALNNTITTYTFPASNAKEYFLSFIVDGTTIEWVIAVFDASSLSPWVRLSRQATQSINNNTATPISWDTETTDLSNMYDSGNPTRITIPGSGNKIFEVSCMVSFAAGATGIRRAAIYKNGALVSFTPSTVSIAPSGAGTSTEILISTRLECTGGEYFEVVATHTQGTALNVVSGLSARVIERA